MKNSDLVKTPHILCLDIGNTHVFGGIFSNSTIQLKFRYPSKPPFTSDQMGLFLRSVLKENGIDPDHIQAICIGSVVPSLNYSTHAACIKYLGKPAFQIKPGVKTGLTFDITHPLELGADRVANAVAAVHHFPNQPLIIIDFGTATTLCAISPNKTYLGGVILPGIKISIEALHQNTAKLPPVDIIKPKQALGKCTVTHIQSGIYYGQIGPIKTLVDRLDKEAFKSTNLPSPTVIATGGFAHLFRQEDIFSKLIPDLTLEGLRLIFQKNL